MDLQTISDFDMALLKIFNGSHSLFMDSIMVTLTSGYTWIPLYIVLFYLVVKNNETMAQILLIVGCCALCMLFSDGLTDLIVKPLVGRYRPSNDPLIKYSIDIVGDLRGTDYSFFSAHAANTFGIAIFFVLLVRSRILSFAMVIWSLINCWTRLYLGLHYPSDIIVGLLWGGIVSSLIYLLYHKIYYKISPKINYISTQYTRTGYSLNDIDAVICVLVMIFIYVVIKANFVMI
jgi:undecaprenyl-diphosphatase